jgi:hypothetical protein
MRAFLSIPRPPARRRIAASAKNNLHSKCFLVFWSRSGTQNKPRDVWKQQRKAF